MALTAAGSNVTQTPYLEDLGSKRMAVVTTGSSATLVTPCYVYLYIRNFRFAVEYVRKYLKKLNWNHL